MLRPFPLDLDHLSLPFLQVSQADPFLQAIPIFIHKIHRSVIATFVMSLQYLSFGNKPTNKPGGPACPLSPFGPGGPYNK